MYALCIFTCRAVSSAPASPTVMRPTRSCTRSSSPFKAPIHRVLQVSSRAAGQKGRAAHKARHKE